MSFIRKTLQEAMWGKGAVSKEKKGILLGQVTFSLEEETRKDFRHADCIFFLWRKGEVSHELASLVSGKKISDWLAKIVSERG